MIILNGSTRGPSGQLKQNLSLFAYKCKAAGSIATSAG